MPVSVLIAANARRLATVADLQADLGAALVQDHVLSLEAMLDQASAAIERACHRLFAQQLYTETFAPTMDGLGGVAASWDGTSPGGPARLFLSRVPTSPAMIRRVSANGTVLTDYRMQNGESGILYRRAGWGYGWTSDDPADDLTVKYIAGYILPEQTNALAMRQETEPLATVPLGEPLPADLIRLTVEAVKVWFHEREPATRVTSRHMGDQSISYSVQAGHYALPKFVLEGLKPWRRWVIR
jgi:hypothetical protein